MFIFTVCTHSKNEDKLYIVDKKLFTFECYPINDFSFSFLILYPLDFINYSFERKFNISLKSISPLFAHKG